MLFKLAWRNIWRNRFRSLITMAAIAASVLLATFMDAMQKGIYDQMIGNVVGFYTGYAQVHKNGYWDEQSLDNTFAKTTEVQQALLQHPLIEQAVPRIESFALAAHENNTTGCLVVGADPLQEDGLTALGQKIVEGSYLTPGSQKALVAIDLAEKLEMGVGDTIILLGQGYHGVSAAGKYEVGGLIKYGSPDLNKRMIYLELETAQELYAAPDRLTSYALGLDRPTSVTQVVNDLRSELPIENYEVMDWQQMMPELVQMMKADSGGNVVALGFLYVIIAFGVFGTVLMMTAERRYEFGVMLAVGMKNLRLALTVVLEVLLITLLGIGVGMAISYPLVWYFHHNPIYMGDQMQEMYEQFGLNANIPTALDADIFLRHGIFVFVFCMLIALYPFIKIMLLRAIKAMRS